MAMDWTTEVVDQVDAHWRERLRPRLDGLSDEEYFWQPVPGCWTLSRRGESTAAVSYGSGDFTWDHGPTDGPEPVTTIAWRLGHVLECLASVNGTHLGGPPARLETFDFPGTADEALERLDAEYAAWLAGIRALGDEGLARPQGDASPPAFAHAPVARVVMYTSVEVFHHGAEVCLLRDLHLRLRPTTA